MTEGPPKWWQFPWKEIASFALGAFILIEQTTFEVTAQPVLVGAGVALCGVAVAGGVQRAAKRVTERE